MNINIDNTPVNSLKTSRYKDNEFSTQYNTIVDFLRYRTASRYMTAVETGIPIQNVCRYVGMLFNCNCIAVVRKDKCSISGETVEFLSTNPLLFPKSNQLKLF